MNIHEQYECNRNIRYNRKKIIIKRIFVIEIPNYNENKKNNHNKNKFIKNKNYNKNK